MRLTKICSCLFLAGTFFVSDAYAENPTTNGDVRCLVVGIKLATSKDDKVRSASQLLTTYYLGLIDGRSPELNLEEAVIDELAKMTAQDVQSEARRCGLAFSARGAALTAMGKDIVQRGEEQVQKGTAPQPH